LLMRFLRQTAGGEGAPVQIVCTGEDSDLYGEHVSSLLTDLEDALKGTGRLRGTPGPTPITSLNTEAHRSIEE
ncbi:MAG TPA: hypothetical protein VNT26_07335, partial [Candidatus Sulfotelmatobacter sp.]|nr:hypothetical protein [Candidatus Sulfotelmatobacter sp.]